MDTETSPDIVRFGEFRFDRRGGGLSWRDSDGEFQPINLGSRALAVLGVLVERSGDLVSRDEIMRAVWPGATVEDANLTVQISALRRALDADRNGNSCILNVPGRGYRFLPSVSRFAERAEPAPAAPPPAVIAPPTPSPWWRHKWHTLAAALFSAALLVVVGFASDLFSPDTAPPRLSVVVLPFENLTGDPKDNYLIEGITEDVTTDLSKVPGMFIIARESAYAYQGKAIDVRKLGKELGVRYVVEGSVRRLGDTLRVGARLVSAETRAELWADRFDQKLGDLSAGQEAIVGRIGQTLNVAITDMESARSKRERPTDPDAFDLILRARSLALHPMGAQVHAERMALFERALRLDPNSVFAMTSLASELNWGWLIGTANGGDLERAANLIATATAINPNDRAVLSASAYWLYISARYSEAIAAYQHLLDEYPNSPIAYEKIGASLIRSGRAEEGIRMIEMAIQRDPQNPLNYDRFYLLGYALLLLGRDEEAIVWTQRSLAAVRTDNTLLRVNLELFLAAACARLGHLDEAHDALVRADQFWPYATVRGIAPLDPSTVGLIRDQIGRYKEALRLAGLRDHAAEDTGFHVPGDGNLRTTLYGPTPTTVPGASTISTAELEQLLRGRQPIVIDPLLYSWGRSIHGAVGLKNAGLGGNTSDALQDRLRKKMLELTKGDLTAPVVAMGWNSERFDGRNLALRLVGLGYMNVYWYRGGREAWEAAGLPETEVDAQDW